MANLLIVDDDPAIREVIAFSLRDSGFQLFQAEDGVQALDILRKNAVHAVLTDREVPGKDALEILLEIRKSQRSVPVIVMVDLGEKDSDQLMDQGAFATIVKPFRLDEMKRIVGEAIPPSVQNLLKKSQVEKTKEKKRVKKVRAASWGAALLLILAAGGLAWRFFKPALPSKSFHIPYTHVSGMASDGQNLWTCDWFSETIYQHALDGSLNLRRPVKLRDIHLTGLAWDGKNLWSVSSWSKKLHRHRADGALKIETEIPAAFSEPAALYIDAEKNFWVSEAKEGKLIKFRLKEGHIDIIWSGKSPALKPVGIFIDRRYLWTADRQSGLIFRQEKDRLETVTAWELPPEMEKGKLTAMTSDGKNFWVGFEGIPKLFRIHPKKLVQIDQTNP